MTMKNLIDDMRALPVWRHTLLEPPPLNTWFMGKFPQDEVMPTYLRADGVCLSVRMKDNDLQVCHHKIALPAEWRP